MLINGCGKQTCLFFLHLLQQELANFFASRLSTVDLRLLIIHCMVIHHNLHICEYKITAHNISGYKETTWL